MTKHSLLPPSSAARRMACPGSLRLEREYGRRENSESANEGSFAHLVASELLKFYLDNPEAECKLDLSQDVNRYAKEYVSLVLSIAGLCKDIHIEEKIDIKSIHDECFGTPDAWIFVDGTLHIIDYKYGFTPVTPYENWQLIAYASGIIDLLKIKDNIEIHLHIFQPRNYVDSRVKVWKTNYFKLRSYFGRLRLSEQLALTDDAPLKPSGECTYCTAKHKCPMLRKSVVALKNYSNLERHNFKENEELSIELRYLKELQQLIEARLLGLEEEATHLLKSGKPVPNFTLVETNTREKWNGSPEIISGIVDLLGIDIKKPIELITPKQAINKGVPEELVKKYSIKPKGELKLKQIEDCKEIFNNPY